MQSGEVPSHTNGNYFHRYLNYAVSLLDNYHGNEPFHLYLKKYFSVNKKHGSKDRKIISSLCYDFFRLGFGVSSVISIEEKLLLATFLIENNSSFILQKLKPDWNEKIQLSLSEKIKTVKNIFTAANIFPFNNELSDEINIDQFNLSFLTQPKLFIRIRPGQQKLVFDKLKTANISFEKLNNSCLAFSNNEKVSDVLLIDKEAVIQDYNSQKTLNLLASYIEYPTSSISIWDCCAASGGKAILAHDLLKDIKLTVSDTRKNILQNLKLRFEKAGIKNYTSFIADLSGSPPPESFSRPFGRINGRPPFDLIIADVPCSGSGTWARTPEQLSFFDKKEIKRYTELQQKIVLNAVPYLKENGFLLYITCSVFKRENEENVIFIQEKTGLQLVKAEYLKGSEMQADTLFVALFKK
ncbi:MAG: Fmu (Sun) domain-containing protein [Bacteroidota bacterium]|nr:Fmu (Sun) domain-containing protein [Bacteroidota bacterium]